MHHVASRMQLLLFFVFSQCCNILASFGRVLLYWPKGSWFSVPDLAKSQNPSFCSLEIYLEHSQERWNPGVGSVVPPNFDDSTRNP